MRSRIAALLMLALFLSPTPVSTGEEAPEQAPPPDETGAAPGGGETGSFEEFVPTEELPADSVIAFPVDI